MKLDRSAADAKTGKYAVVNMRKVHAHGLGGEMSTLPGPLRNAFRVLEDYGVINYGEPRSESEFFVIMLKDKFSADALGAYAKAATEFDKEYAGEVKALAARAGEKHKACKVPD